MDICRGYLHFAKRKGLKHMEKSTTSGKAGEGGGLGEGAFVGDCMVMRESDITGDERCREKFTCRLSTLEAKYAFLNSQSLEQMAAGDAADTDLMVCPADFRPGSPHLPDNDGQHGVSRQLMTPFLCCSGHPRLRRVP